MSADATIVDARGLLCPWPVLRLVRAVRQLPQGGAFRVLADDPAAAREIMELCGERGWTFAPNTDDPHAFNVLISPSVNRLFTSKV